MMNHLKSSFAAIALLVPALPLSSCQSSTAANNQASSTETQKATKEPSMLIQYLEIVTSDVDSTCSVLAKVHGVSFGEPDPGLGNARTAALNTGGRIGVRAPMAEQDMKIVRPYVLVEEIGASEKTAEAAGGEIAMRAMEIPGHGKFAIYFLAGTQFAFWENLPPTAGSEPQSATEKPSMAVQFLEVVNSDVDATCSALAKVHGVTFGDPDAMLGNARTAALASGGRISVRAPMAEHDKPIVRPYLLVDDIEVAIKATEAAGGEFAMRATEIPGQGKFAIYILADTQFGLWETPSSK